MKKVVKKNKLRYILLTVLALIFILFVLLPITFSLLETPSGNVALIPLEGVITSNGGSYLGESTISSKDIVKFIEEADENNQIKVIVLEINSPGGTPVGSDEIATAIKKTEKPVISVIRETGASGAYWIASSSDYIIANKMSITGSIGVVSSYLEFSGLMEKYGVGYERLIAGEYKDIGVPYRKLTVKEEQKMQNLLDKLHDFFIEEVAINRNMEINEIKKLATGEVFLGIEALDLGLVDELGDLSTAEDYIKENYNLTEIGFVTYAKETGFLGSLLGLTNSFSYNIGEGLGSVFVKRENLIMI
ncbi:MAG: signal peptide peptidase SppA [Candidatus Woesearchaeota archaeon]